MKINSCYSRIVCMLVSTIGFSGAVNAATTPAACEAAQLRVAALLTRAVFTCESKYVLAPLRDRGGAIREACWRTAAGAFQTAYNKTLDTAARAGVVCPQTINSSYLNEKFRQELQGLAVYQRGNWNSASATSNTAYSAIMKATGSYLGKVLTAEAGNVLKPNITALLQTEKTAEDALNQAGAATGVLSFTESVGSSASVAVNSMIAVLKGDLVTQRITAGDYHTCLLLTDGSLKCWGPNNHGELGQGNTTTLGDGAGEMGNNLPVVPLDTGNPVRKVGSGEYHACAILDDQSIKCWGGNASGQLGLGDTNDRGDNSAEMAYSLPKVDVGTGRSVRQVVGGSDTTCALLDNNTVKCWGGNVNGDLGLGDTTARGGNPADMGNNLPAVDLGTGRTALQISMHYLHVCALLDNHNVKCWGYNSSGELGQGDTNSRGDNAGEMGDNLSAIDLGTGRTARAVVTGGDHSCALLDDNTVKCWGYNNGGELGLGDTAKRGDNPGEMGDNLPTVDLGSGRVARQIAAGWDHTCALLDDYSVKCWGQNGAGQLGLGDITAHGANPGEMGDNLPTVDLGGGHIAREIFVYGNRSCALLDNGDLKCWGENTTGELGQGDTNNRGDNANEMDFYLKAVDLGTVIAP